MQNTFKFCPKCKNKLKQSFNLPAGRLVDCSSCGFHFYINPAVTNAVILENERGEILLVKRKSKPFAGYWDLPGGFVDYDESCEESTIREIEEELKITIDKIKYLCSFPDIYPYKEFEYHTLCFFYICKLSLEQEKQLKYSDDITGFKFFKKDKIPYEKLSFKGLEYAI